MRGIFAPLLGRLANGVGIHLHSAYTSALSEKIVQGVERTRDEVPE